MRLMRDLVGETLSGRYRLLTRIAGGGMGDVYRAHDLLLDRAVAVKILQPSLAAEPDLVERFRFEARAAARLTHPNAVAVYDWGAEDDRTYYMVMEYVPGTDLRDVLVGRGSLEATQAVEVVTAVCDALAAAHAEGLVHRDVKPENVLIARSGKVKVADFGIAVVADADRTVPGGIPGTLRYLSPEQARGAEASHASDIWAAGAILSECLTGRPPAHGSSGDLLKRRGEDPPVAPSEHNRDIPSEVDEIVLTACALEPADRYPDAASMADALRDIRVRTLGFGQPLSSLLEDVTGDVRLPEMEATGWMHKERDATQRPRRRRLLRAVLTAIVLALLATGSVWAMPFLFGPAKVDVPSVVDQSRGQAVDMLTELGLETDIERAHSRIEARGQVLSQSPQGGTLEEGSTVTLTISSGPDKVTLPSVVGLSLEKAKLRLATRGLELGEVTKEYSHERIRTVIAQRPLKERLPWGSKVDLVLSRGPEPIEVPDVLGLKAEKAARVLEQVGFTVAQTDAYSNDVAPGRVVSTSPAAGELGLDGGEVQLSVSIGPEFEELKMPDVTGMALSDARAKLTSLGLRVRVVNSCDGGNIVAETEPLAGTTVRENDLVALFVC
jgi:eukaryotic-like serine/threonine-protein kinase